MEREYVTRSASGQVKDDISVGKLTSQNKMENVPSMRYMNNNCKVPSIC